MIENLTRNLMKKEEIIDKASVENDEKDLLIEKKDD